MSKKNSKQQDTTRDFEQVAADNLVWLGELDHAEAVANRLDLVSLFVSDVDCLGLNDRAASGLCSILDEASDTIRELCATVRELRSAEQTED